MIPQLRTGYDAVLNWGYAQPPSYWLTVVGLLFVCACVAYTIQHPRYLEGAMARKKEREKVASILLTAFERALVKEELSLKVQQKWLTRIGKGAGLPDLIPRNHQQLPFKFKPDLHKTKILSIRRLYAMGVDVGKFLQQRKGRSPASKKLPPVLRKS